MSAGIVAALTVGGMVTLVGVGSAGADVTFVVNDATDASLQTSGDTNCVSTSVVGETHTCTLRAAIEAANNLSAATSGTVTTITLPNANAAGVANPASAYVLTISQLNINGTVIINGQSQTGTVIDGAGTFAVFSIGGSGNATINTVTIQNGSGGTGGGIYNGGTLALNNSTVTNNTANSGGGIAQDDNGNGATTTLTGDTISHNHALVSEGGGDGGGLYIYGAVDPATTITGTTFSGNTADVNGGGLAVEGPDTLNITNDSFTGNTANDRGTCCGVGGGLYTARSGIGSAAIAVTGTIFSTNSAYDGGGIAIASRGYTTFSIGTSTISNNSVSEGGGGVYDDLESTPALDIHTSTVSGNHAAGEVGESFTGDGGGVLSSFCSPVTMTNDTVANNTASHNGGGFDSEACNTVSLARSGAHSQQANANVPHVVASTQDTFVFDTFNANSAGNSAGGGNIQQNDPSSAITFAETIVANGVVNSAPTTNCFLNSNSSSAGYNLIDDTTCGTPGTGDIIGQNPLLGTLGNNGGTSISGNAGDGSAATISTDLPGAGSPAIGGVPQPVCAGTGINSDERGLTRPGSLDGTCTIGAVEVQIQAPPPPPTFNPNGYRMGAVEGGVFDFGIQFHGSLANAHLNAPIVGLANYPGPDAYLLVGADGGVFALGGANYYGSLGGQTLPAPIATIAATPDGGGYWLASTRGTVYNFGNAPQLPAVQLPARDHIVGIASTNDGKGLWLTDNAGDIYTLGDAQYLGSLGGHPLNAPVVGIAPAATGQGYILVAADGGAFAFGVGFFGSVPGVLQPGQKLNAPVVGIAETHSGKGYWIVGADGGVFCFGDAPFLGSTYTQLQPGQHLNGPIVAIQHLGGQTSV